MLEIKSKSISASIIRDRGKEALLTDSFEWDSGAKTIWNTSDIELTVGVIILQFLYMGYGDFATVVYSAGIEVEKIVESCVYNSTNVKTSRQECIAKYAEILAHINRCKEGLE